MAKRPWPANHLGDLVAQLFLLSSLGSAAPLEMAKPAVSSEPCSLAPNCSKKGLVRAGFRSTTSAPAAGWETMLRIISSRCAQCVMELDMSPTAQAPKVDLWQSRAQSLMANTRNVELVCWQFALDSRDQRFHFRSLHGYNSHEDGELECAASMWRN